MPITLPNVSFDPAKTIVGAAVRVVFTPSGGGTAINLIGKMADFQYKNTKSMRNVPGVDGINRPDREWSKEASESFDLEMEEMDLVITTFGGFTSKPKKGTAVVWVSDQDDPVGTSVRLKSDSFPCTLSLKDGTTKFGGGDISKAVIHVQSLKNDQIIFTPNATT